MLYGQAHEAQCNADHSPCPERQQPHIESIYTATDAHVNQPIEVSPPTAQLRVDTYAPVVHLGR
jgi:hypothetical protein